jgi:cellulose synthase/poly-beta-1,6-N-acetylglucosamine synthase-like glycosyltransferase
MGSRSGEIAGSGRSPGRCVIPTGHRALTEGITQPSRDQKAWVPMVTVVVPMRNEEEFIGGCLDSLIRQDYPPERLEVLVGDGRSEDTSRSIVLAKSQEHDFIRLLDNPKEIAAAALNQGIRNATGDVIIILSAHSSVADDFVSQNVAYLQKTGVDCVGGPIHSTSQSPLGQTISLAMSSPFGVGNALFRYSQKEQYVDTVAFGAYQRQVFDEIGLFDEILVYNEDDEFNYRLRKHGGRILLTPAIRSSYHTRTSLGQLWSQYFRYGRGKIRVMQRHPESAMIRHFVPFAFVSALAVTGLLGVLNPAGLWLFLFVLASYLAVSLLFSIRICASHGWKHLPVLPVAFACLHFSYGLGTYSGLLSLLMAPKHK